MFVLPFAHILSAVAAVAAVASVAKRGSTGPRRFAIKNKRYKQQRKQTRIVVRELTHTLTLARTLTIIHTQTIGRLSHTELFVVSDYS